MSQQAGFSGYSWQNQKDAAALVADLSGQLWEASRWFLEDLTDGNVKPAMEAEHKGKKLPVFVVDKDGEAWRTSTRSYVNKCVYDALNACRMAFGYGSFAPSDEAYFRDHPLVDTGGVQRSGVLNVAHALLEPWGLGISKVYLPKETPMSPLHVRFAELLKMNPMAIGDRRTSNEEFADFLKESGMDDGEISKFVSQFNWEYVDKPKLPAVIMYSHGDAKGIAGNVPDVGDAVVKAHVKVPTSSPGGHASFYGPRDNVPSGWKIAIKIARINELSYDTSSLNDIVNEEGAGTKVLDIANCKFDGKKQSQHRSTKVTTYKGGQVTRAGVWQGYNQGQAGNESGNNGNSAAYSPNAINMIITGTEIKQRLNVQDNQSCLICGGEIVTSPSGISETCVDCTWDSQRYAESTFVDCSKHGTPMYFDKYDLKGTKGTPPYFCPICVGDEGLDVFSFLGKGGATTRQMVKRPK